MQVTRVIVDDGGYGVPPERAKQQYDIESAIYFKRSDGWSLGAPLQFEDIAYRLWANEWTHFATSWDETWRPISEYKG